MAFGNFCFRFTSTTLKNFSYDSVMTTKIPKFLLNPVSFRARRIIFQVKSVKKYSKITAVLWSLKKLYLHLKIFFPSLSKAQQDIISWKNPSSSKPVSCCYKANSNMGKEREKIAADVK